MSDVFTSKKRSAVMARIRGQGNKTTELALAAILRAEGVSGWRRHLPLPGRPDFAFPRVKIAIFVDGCFWHGCPKCYRRPASNRRFWDGKLLRNQARDRLVSRQLRIRGWTVFRIWEHDLKRPRLLMAQLRLWKRMVARVDSRSRSGAELS